MLPLPMAAHLGNLSGGKDLLEVKVEQSSPPQTGPPQDPEEQKPSPPQFVLSSFSSFSLLVGAVNLGPHLGAK